MVAIVAPPDDTGRVRRSQPVRGAGRLHRLWNAVVAVDTDAHTGLGTDTNADGVTHSHALRQSDADADGNAYAITHPYSAHVVRYG